MSVAHVYSCVLALYIFRFSFCILLCTLCLFHLIFAHISYCIVHGQLLVHLYALLSSQIACVKLFCFYDKLNDDDGDDDDDDIENQLLFVHVKH